MINPPSGESTSETFSQDLLNPAKFPINGKLPARSVFSESQTLQLKSSYPASKSRPDFENATDVIPQIMLSCEYMASSWSARISNRRQVASSEPVANAQPLGKNCKLKDSHKSVPVELKI